MGVEVNFKESLGWRIKSAEHGNVYSQWQLANFYLLGAGVPKDEKEGIGG